MFRNLSCLMKSENFNLLFILNFKLPLLFLCSHFFQSVTVTSYHKCRSQTVLLSLWDSFLANEGAEMLSKLHTYPVIIARRVKVNNYNGLFPLLFFPFLALCLLFSSTTPVSLSPFFHGVKESHLVLGLIQPFWLIPLYKKQGNSRTGTMYFQSSFYTQLQSKCCLVYQF